jgi:putative membrane protein
MMVKDHTQANEQLKSIAAKKKMALPAQMMEKHQKHVSELSKLSGSEFDTHYMSMMVQDHQEDVTKFQQASNGIPDADLKSFATKTLPTLQMHLEKAQQVNSSLQGGSASVEKK